MKKELTINTYTPKVAVFRRCRNCGSGLPQGWHDVYCELCEDLCELPEIKEDETTEQG